MRFSGFVGATSSPPFALAIATQPASSAASGVPLTQQPVIQIVTPLGGLATTIPPTPVTATISYGLNGAISGTATVNTVNGVATFTNLTITGIDEYQITFSSTNGITAVTSGFFNLSNPWFAITNEPIGFTTYTDRRFDSVVRGTYPNASLGDDAWEDLLNVSGLLSVVDNTTVFSDGHTIPHPPGKTNWNWGQQHYPIEFPVGSAPAITGIAQDRVQVNHTFIHLDYWISETWIDVGTNKTWFVDCAGATGTNGGHIYFYLAGQTDGSTTSLMFPRLAGQGWSAPLHPYDCNDGRGPVTDPSFKQNQNMGNIVSAVRGRPFSIEIELLFNSQDGATDGRFRWWYADAFTPMQLCGDYQNIGFGNGPFPNGGRVVESKWSPNRGGGGVSHVTHDIWQMCSRAYISGP